MGDFSVPRSVGIVYRSLDWGLSQGKVLTCVLETYIITYKSFRLIADDLYLPFGREELFPSN